MFKSGLASVTFRKLTPREIVDLAIQAGIQAIEWGGDIHVPHGDLNRAREVAKMTHDAGMDVACYGSYYRLGDEAGISPPFSAVVESALELGAPSIRVWAGDRGSADADSDYRRRVVSEALDLAGQLHGLRLAYEYHDNTLTDTAESTADLLHHTQHPGIHTLWQPSAQCGMQENLAAIRRLRPRLLNLHVFQTATIDGVRTRQALVEGSDPWRAYLEEAGVFESDGYCLLEFVRDDSHAQFLQDAATLKNWLWK